MQRDQLEMVCKVETGKPNIGGPTFSVAVFMSDNPTLEHHDIIDTVCKARIRSTFKIVAEDGETGMLMDQSFNETGDVATVSYDKAAGKIGFGNSFKPDDPDEAKAHALHFDRKTCRLTLTREGDAKQEAAGAAAVGDDDDQTSMFDDDATPFWHGIKLDSLKGVDIDSEQAKRLADLLDSKEPTLGQFARFRATNTDDKAIGIDPGLLKALDKALEKHAEPEPAVA